MSYFCGLSQSFKGLDFPILLMGLITVSLLPQNLILRAIGPRDRLILTPGYKYFLAISTCTDRLKKKKN